MTKMKFITTIIIAAYTITTMTACSSNSINSITTSEVESTTSTVESIVPETTTSTESTTKVEITTPETTTTTVETTTVPETEISETTSETTTMQTTTSVTTPAPQWTEEAVNGTKYINTACYSRKNAILGAETVKLYNVNDKVMVVAKTDTGYYKLDNNSFIHADYLSDNKVAITTTTAQTTTKPQTEAPVASDAEQVDLTVYSARPNVRLYLDADCTDIRVAQANDGTFVYSETSEPLDKLIGTYSWMEWTGTEFKVVEYIKSKDCYKREDGLYVKRSDVVLTDPVEAMYHYPFDFDAIKQYIIDDAVNNYGLVYDPGYKFEGSTWFPPMQVDKSTPAWIFKRNLEGDEYIMGQVASSVSDGYMEAGDTFNVYIERVDLTDRKEQLGYDEGWLIYFLRG